jgi:hypothetical protein
LRGRGKIDSAIPINTGENSFTMLCPFEHRHLNIFETELCKRYRIPWILSCGKSTEKSKQYDVNKKGEATETVLKTGLLGNIIDIDSEGNISVKTITF